MENVHTESLVSKTPSHPLLIIAAIAVILFCTAGIAAIMGWIPKGGADTDVPGGATSATTSAATSAPATPSTPAPSATHRATAKAPTTKPHPLQVSPEPLARATCRECGVIESIRTVEKAGEGSGAGAVAGGVLGGVVGHQMGNGRGQDVMTVVGAVGGALAGNQIEKNMKKNVVYQLTVRFDDGTSRQFSQASAPAWRAGDRVRVSNGELRPEA